MALRIDLLHVKKPSGKVETANAIAVGEFPTGGGSGSGGAAIIGSLGDEKVQPKNVYTAIRAGIPVYIRVGVETGVNVYFTNFKYVWGSAVRSVVSSESFILENDGSVTMWRLVGDYNGTAWTLNKKVFSDGKSAYQLAVEQGFSGSINDWLNSLKGSKGDTPSFQIGTVSTLEAGARATATITNNNGSYVLNLGIPKGADGSGGTGGGEKGDPGYTPVRGVDYWTEYDKQQIINSVIATIGTYNGEVS